MSEQKKITDYLSNDFSNLKDKLLKYQNYNAIKDLVEKIESDIEKLGEIEKVKNEKKIIDYQKAKVTYLTENDQVKTDILKFDTEPNNPIIKITEHKILNNVQFFVITENFKKMRTKSINNRVLKIINVEVLNGKNTQANLEDSKFEPLAKYT